MEQLRDGSNGLIKDEVGTKDLGIDAVGFAKDLLEKSIQRYGPGHPQLRGVAVARSAYIRGITGTAASSTDHRE
jgi:hypothetical protein